nr:unnamed protein product [Spirometra erinaceieuropaei]
MYIGKIFAVFHSDDSLSNSNDERTMCASGLESSFDNSFKNLAGILAGPEDFASVRLFSSLSMTVVGKSMESSTGPAVSTALLALRLRNFVSLTAFSPIYTTRPQNLTVRGTSSGASRQLTARDPAFENPFRQIFAKYPRLTRSNFGVVIPPHNVVHRIPASDPPVFPRSRRLALDILLPPKSCSRIYFRWAPSVSLKAHGSHPSTWLPRPPPATGASCDDYRALKNIIIPVRYPVPHLQNSAGKSAFSKIDLACAFHQIPIAPEDVSKMGVTIPFGFFDFLRMPSGRAMLLRPFRGS